MVGEAYGLGALTAAIYHFLPLQGATASLGEHGLPGLIAAGVLKGVVIVGVYGGLLVIWRALRSRRGDR